jgi:hypothetical protein
MLAIGRRLLYTRLAVSHRAIAHPTRAAPGADVCISLEAMYLGIDMYSSITLQQLYFVKGGSVQVGSYLYDGPGKEDGERLIPFGQVPPVVYCEAVGDLQKISGKSQTAGSSE